MSPSPGGGDRAATAGVRFSVWAVALMTSAAVVSLRGLPMMAKEGLTMWFYIGFATLLFLIPGSFVAAELGGMFNTDKGGIYTWVSEAFGSSWGFAAVWLQWIQNVVWYPVVLGFTAATLAYLVGDAGLAQNHMYNFAVVVGVYWLATFLAMFGEKSYGNWSQWLFVLGTVVPGVFLMLLAAVWLWQGHPAEIMQQLVATPAAITPAMAGQQVHPWLPSIAGLGSIAFLAGTVLLFAGVEVQGARASLMRKPAREFPEAMIVAAGIVFLLFTLGSLAVATIIPIKQLSLTAGIMQAYSVSLALFHLSWLVPVAAAFLAVGALGQIITWIGGPSRALLQTAENGEIPAWFARTNAHGAPKTILVLQAVIVSVLGLFYLVFPDPSAAFYLLSAMTVALYLVMYLLMYAAAIKLHHSRPDAERHFRVPGGTAGMWLIAGGGFVAVLFALVVSFFPPSEVPVGSPGLYTTMVALGLVVFGGAPFLLHAFKRPEWLRAAHATH